MGNWGLLLLMKMESSVIGKQIYSVGNQTGSQKINDRMAGGKVLIFHISPEDYHHYCYVDDGGVEERCGKWSAAGASSR